MMDRTVTPATDVNDSDKAGRPFYGVGLLVASALATLAILIYFGAWAASERVSARTGVDSADGQNAAWEEGLLFVCPFH